MRPLFLASRSPRRRELLEEAGIPFVTLEVEVGEDAPAGLAPEEVARMLAERKARAGAAHIIRGLVLGADTVVALGGECLGKPRDREDARRMLRRLSGTTHRVITGVCLVDGRAGLLAREHASTTVTMRPLEEDEIDAYVATGEADDKAGAYAIQERGDRFVERIEGSYSNVVGLPLELLVDLLREREER